MVLGTLGSTCPIKRGSNWGSVFTVLKIETTNVRFQLVYESPRGPPTRAVCKSYVYKSSVRTHSILITLHTGDGSGDRTQLRSFRPAARQADWRSQISPEQPAQVHSPGRPVKDLSRAPVERTKPCSYTGLSCVHVRSS